MQQPEPITALCHGGVAVLAVGATGPSTAGVIAYQWQWHPSSITSWTDIQTGVNSRGGGTFTTPNAQSSGIILDFSPGHGVFPPSFLPEFRCVVSNACTSKTSDTAVLTSCGTCPTDPGSQTAKWRIASFDPSGHMTGQTPVAPGTGWEQHFDCKCPTALILHGWHSGPDATWIPCLADAAKQRYSGCVNILIADASPYMAPVDIAGASGVAGAVAAMALGIPGTAGLAAAGAAGDLLGAKHNIPAAGQELADDLQCFLCTCGAGSGIDLVIGHSFGGGIAAEIGQRIAECSGRTIPMLITIDTPYNVFNLVTMGEQADRSGRYFGRHLNYYSPCRSGLGFGSPLGGAGGGGGGNVRNFNAGAGDRVTSRCMQMQHTCLAEEICGLLGSGAGWALVDGSLPPGEYMEGASPNTVVPGNQSPNCDALDVPPWDNPTIVGNNLGAGLNARQGVTEAGGVLELRPPSSSSSSYAGGTVTLTGCGGFLIFEYQIDGPLSDQTATVAWNGQVRWSASVETPVNQWFTAIIDVRNGCVTTGSLVFRLDPPSSSGQPNPAAAFRVRNVRIIHRDIRECTAPPVIAIQPANVSVRRSGAMALGVGADWPYGLTYQWEKDGVPVTDGVQASGATVVGAAGPILVMSQITTIEAGNYRCVVTNACGNVSSNTATVTVCIADTNSDGVTNSQDFFDFIAAFFSSQPSADVNSDGTINSQDFFDFLAAFFAGC